MTDVVAEFSQLATDHLAGVLREAREALDAAAHAVVQAQAAGRLVHVTGAGHSLAGVVETFYRAGGLAGVRPLWHPDLLPLNGAQRSTEAERRTGLAAEVLSGVELGVGDVVVIFSNSGVNAYPIEIAQAARDAGATVMAVTSVTASRQAPLRAGDRLFEISDIVIDTAVSPGDVSWPVGRPRTAPLSSMVNAAVWDAILVLVQQIDPTVTVWESANVADASASNDAAMERFASRVPELLRGSHSDDDSS